MRVVVSQRVDEFSERDELRDALDHRLITFLLEAGFLPVPIPNSLCMEESGGSHSHDMLDIWLREMMPVAIVLSGGNDIGQYNVRDLTEERLLNYARNHRLPVLGICRGMQMMARWTGGDFHLVEGHVRTRHFLTGQFSKNVNSYHAFSLKSCPEEFEVLAHSEDGEIEAIGHVSLPWEGWMWHPEREAIFDSHDIQRLKELFL